MTHTTRQVYIGQTISLDMEIEDANGVNLDAYDTPAVAIVDAKGNTRRASSILDVVRLDVGRYRFRYTVPDGYDTGQWNDVWTASINDVTLISTLAFSVCQNDDSIDIAKDEIGDPARIEYTEEEIIGINILLPQLKARLKNNLESETIDEFGNLQFTECYVFTNEELSWFLRSSLSEFNQTPHFTDFLFSEPVIYERFAHIIVEGAFILAAAAQMLIEAGREFTITDNGITMNPPPLSTVLNNELAQFVTRHTEALKYIKTSIKPRPVGFGGFRVLAISPNFLRLRHLRQRRIV